MQGILRELSQRPEVDKIIDNSVAFRTQLLAALKVAPINEDMERIADYLRDPNNPPPSEEALWKLRDAIDSQLGLSQQQGPPKDSPPKGPPPRGPQGKPRGA